MDRNLRLMAELELTLKHILRTYSRNNPQAGHREGKTDETLNAAHPLTLPHQQHTHQHTNSTS